VPFVGEEDAIPADIEPLVALVAAGELA
jgi:hypothetical protein